MSAAPLTLRALISRGITHVVGLPDSTSGPLFLEAARHPSLHLVTVTREGEAFAIATGLWMGGASPVVVIQNTGLLESGDAIRGTALRAGAPIPILVTGRGYAKMHAAGVSPVGPLSRDLLTRADVDTTAVFTERTLEAWGVPFQLCEGEADPVEILLETIDAARDHEHPAAMVLARSLS
jgi:sulfopyruvate decarboxylase subunit alpha